MVRVGFLENTHLHHHRSDVTATTSPSLKEAAAVFACKTLPHSLPATKVVHHSLVVGERRMLSVAFYGSSVGSDAQISKSTGEHYLILELLISDASRPF